MTDENRSSATIGIGQTSLGDILCKIWVGRRTVGLGMLAGLLGAVILLNTSVYKYTADLTVIPTPSTTDAMSQKLGDLASLTGVNLGKSQGGSPFVVYSAIIKSRAVSDAMSMRPEIMHKVFKSRWDEQSKSWRKPSQPIAFVVNSVKRLFGIYVAPWAPPGGAELDDYIENNVDITQDPKKPTLVMEYSDRDPVFAALFLKTLHETTDNLLRQTNLDRASRYAAYIEGKLATVNQTELRQVLVQNLSQQETLLMMSSSDTPFAAQPIGAAESSARPTTPKSARALMTGLAFGGVFGAALAIYGISLVSLLLGLWNSVTQRRN